MRGERTLPSRALAMAAFNDTAFRRWQPSTIQLARQGQQSLARHFSAGYMARKQNPSPGRGDRCLVVSVIAMLRQ